jgi:heme-degrading monooxygenase HmoA
MYANWVTFNMGAGKRQQMEEMGKKFGSALQAMKGFKNVMFLGNEKTGEYGALVIWETKEDAEAGFQSMFPQLQEAVKGKVKEPPKRVLFEVIKA